MADHQNSTVAGRLSLHPLAMELLASRFCHDLISPMSAIANGLELLEDDEGSQGEMGAEAIRIATDSAQKGLGLLQFFRIAYGNAGVGAVLSGQEVESLAQGYLVDSKIAVTLNEGAQQKLPGGHGRFMLAAIPPAADCLPYGGKIALSFAASPEGYRLIVTMQPVAGREIRMPEDLENLLSLDPSREVAALDARSILAYLWIYGLRNKGGKVKFQRDQQKASFEMELPSRE